MSPTIGSTTCQLALADRWDHLLARWAVSRMGHRNVRVSRSVGILIKYLRDG
jgi:hypothetical protein